MALKPEDTELDMYADDSTECATRKTMAILEEKLKADTDNISEILQTTHKTAA